MEASGLTLNEANREQLVSNLLTVICAEARVQPTIPVGGGHDQEGQQNEALEKFSARLESLASLFQQRR